MERDRDTAMAAIRSVYRITGRINTGTTVTETLDLIAEAVVAGVGFGVAVVNYLHPEGVYEAVAIAGNDEARAELLGARYPAEEFEAHLRGAEPWGQLMFVSHDLHADGLQSWIPDPSYIAADVPEEERWHPLDGLFAPLLAPSGETVGILSVDLPSDGKRPGPFQREMLELLAAQAGIAINNANLVEALRRERQHLEASEAAFRLAFDGAGTGMCMIAMEGGTLPTSLTRVNPALCELLGRDEETLVAMRFADLVHPDDLDRVREVFARGRSVYDYELRCVRGDGETVWVAATMSVVAGSPSFAITQVQDITDRKAAEADLVRRASRDPLTGLVNRDAFAEPLAGAIRRARSEGYISALLFCDLDDFKVINDTLGHEAGDAVLVAVAHRLVSLVRPTDTVGRLGGDEFVVLTGNVSGVDLGALVDRLERSVSAPITHEGHIMRVAVSVGVAVIDATVDDAGAALRAADRAMYLVKGGRHAGGTSRRTGTGGDLPGAQGGRSVVRLARPETAQ